MNCPNCGGEWEFGTVCKDCQFEDDIQTHLTVLGIAKGAQIDLEELRVVYPDKVLTFAEVHEKTIHECFIKYKLVKALAGLTCDSIYVVGTYAIIKYRSPYSIINLYLPQVGHRQGIRKVGEMTRANLHKYFVSQLDSGPFSCR